MESRRGAERIETDIVERIQYIMKKIKQLMAAGLLLLAAASMAACGSSKTEQTEAQANNTGSDSGVTGDTIKMSLFLASVPENTPSGGALKKMAEYINENSNGTLKATAFYDTALGDATSMVQGLQMGTIDIGVCGTAYFSGLVPEVDVFQLPFLFSNLDQARAAIQGPAKDAIFEKLSSRGIVGLSFWDYGFRELTNNVRPIKTPDDMKGIKMRTLPSEVQVETWKAMGALPATIDAAELYTALQQGTVSAQDNPLHEIVARKFYEVQPYITMTDAVYTPLLMAMSDTTWNRLSDSQKQVIMDATEVAREEQFRLTDEAQIEARQVLVDAGCQFEENPDKEAFREKAMPTWSIFTDTYGTELVDMIQAGLTATESTAEPEDAAEAQSAAETESAAEAQSAAEAESTAEAESAAEAESTAEAQSAAESQQGGEQ